ncbi:MAG: GlmU family protein [Bacteroidales bacterium]
MNYILSDGGSFEHLKPLTFTRPVAELRCGILTVREKWNTYLQTECSYQTIDYLSHKYPLVIQDANVIINASFLPHITLVEAIVDMQAHDVLLDSDNTIIAACMNSEEVCALEHVPVEKFNVKRISFDCLKIMYPWDIFSLNSNQIDLDFELLTKGRSSQPVSDTNTVLCPENVFVEKGASVECAVLQAQNGKIYIGKDATVMEGAIIRGPFALCEHATVKMAAKVYEGTTVGPYSKIGGEVQNSVILGYSNKGHDGYLGNSVIGEWCNLGADTNNSNLKNDYSLVRAWNYDSHRFIQTGLQFCGLIMGDHSKTAINTMLNTGTVVGVSANIFGSGFPRNFVPSFSWGGAQGMQEYTLKRAIDVAQRVYARRGIEFTIHDVDILTDVFEQTKKYRRF